MKLLYKFKVLYGLFFVLIIHILVSCSNDKAPEQIKIFRYNESANISSLDPAFAKDQAMIWANLQLFNGLVQLEHP